MRWLLLNVIAFTVVLAVGRCAEAADCAASPREIWSAHPHAHPRWRLQDGKHCWYAGHPSSPQHARRDRRRAYGMVTAPVPQIPMPRPRADWELLHPEQYQRLTPAEGTALWRATGGD